MAAKKKTSFISMIKKSLLYGGTSAITLAISYLFIHGATLVHTGMAIGIYLLFLFGLLPLLCFFIISLFIYILDRLIPH